MPYGRAGQVVMKAYKEHTKKKAKPKPSSGHIGPKEQTLFTIPGEQKRGGRAFTLEDKNLQRSRRNIRLKPLAPTR